MNKKEYIPALKFNKEDLFVRNFDKPYWTPKDKVKIDNIIVDKSLHCQKNDILESTIIKIISNFDLLFWIPITINKDYFLLDGQHRLEAAKRMKLKFIDVIIQDTRLIESNKTTNKIRFKKFTL